MSGFVCVHANAHVCVWGGGGSETHKVFGFGQPGTTCVCVGLCAYDEPYDSRSDLIGALARSVYVCVHTRPPLILSSASDSVTGTTTAVCLSALVHEPNAS